jgi:hypothetical protein
MDDKGDLLHRLRDIFGCGCCCCHGSFLPNAQIMDGSGRGIKRKEVGKPGAGIFQAGPVLFPDRKEKTGIFFGRENILPARPIDCF